MTKECDLFFMQYAVACIYNKLSKTDDYKMGLSIEDILEKIGCLEVVKSVLRGKCTEKKADFAVEQIIKNSEIDKELCEKIKYSRGLRRMIHSDFHDAKIANVRVQSNNLEMILNVNSGMRIKNAFYRKVARITYENVSDFTFDGNESELICLNVSRNYENVVNGKIHIKMALWNDQLSNQTQAYYFSLYCDDLQIEQVLVED